MEFLDLQETIGLKEVPREQDLNFLSVSFSDLGLNFLDADSLSNFQI